ncbi:hypothetical protein AVEN_35357-1 [Araneus ventricosus]|uniref:Uncharacterized protein n=1 Tax=Araneus ventricosus TaxID=182803 RepID=A0A4Y2LAJ3_ARAVE|nr:hypothetical protein AVEN_35357-1 [Araneus ventricosus]
MHKAGHSPSICSNPFGGFLNRPFLFQPIKFGEDLWATRSPRLLCRRLRRFQKGSPHPDFPRLTSTHTPHLPFCGFRFCERGSVRLTDYRISVLWSSGPNESPNRMEFQLFLCLHHFSSVSHIDERIWYLAFQISGSDLPKLSRIRLTQVGGKYTDRQKRAVFPDTSGENASAFAPFLRIRMGKNQICNFNAFFNRFKR